jgi:hypothetical protein
MYHWTVDFDMVPETVAEGDEWLEKVGLVAWSKQPFVTRVSVLKHALSTVPRRTMVMEVTSLDELQRYLGSPQRLKGRPDFEKYVKNETNTTKEVMFQAEKS